MKNIIIISQARYGSTRLPGKVLLEVLDKPLLWYVVQRLKQVKTPSKIVIATVDTEENLPIIELAKNLNVGFFAGSEDDVLDRYYQAAKKYQADIIVRITSDCPLTDPEIIDQALDLFLNGDYDYVCNVDPPTYPDGFDTEVFSFNALERAWNDAKMQSEREHVTLYIRDEKNDFKRNNFKYDKDYNEYRLTVDTKEDFLLISEIIKNFKDNWESFTMQEVVDFLQQKPDLLEINIQYQRNEGLTKSLKEDKKIKSDK